MPIALTQTSDDHLTFSGWFADTLVRWRTIARVVGLMVVLAVLAVIFIPPVYRSRASFVANSSASSKLASGLGSGAGALGGLAATLGMGSSLDPSESPNFYIQLIQSRELLTRLLNSRFADPRSDPPKDSAVLLDLLRIRQKDPQRKLELGIKQMEKDIVGGFDSKTSLVWIDVDAEWPQLSAAVANRTIELVTAFNKEQRTSRARTKRLFLEGRVNLARTQLQAVEARHRSFLDQNRQWRSSPELTFEEKQIQRDEDQAGDLYLTLQRQFEAALLDEVNDAALITVVDSAVPPRKAQWPRYLLLLASTLIAGLILGFLVAGAGAVLDDWRARNPDSAANLGGSLGRIRREIRGAFRRAS
ncbi:MAG TPA: GNVR domain-containing protein [Gemmatimonadaceae bacterium]